MYKTIILLAFLLASCGLKKALYLPDEGASKQTEAKP
jgi:predicted small lipoprotein YifL